MSYKLTPEAENDLIEIYLYGFQNFGEAQAENYFSELEEVFRMLGETALICRERLEFSPPVRIHPHGCHLIIYVLHANRHFDRSSPSPQYGCPAAFVGCMTSGELRFYLAQRNKESHPIGST